MSATIQASAVAIGRRAILIEGAPGSGKSSLALALIDRGAMLVGDDGVLVEARGGGVVVMPHPNTRGLVEVRNLGVLTMPACDGAQLALVVSLDAQAPRFVEHAQTAMIAGRAVPRIALWPDSANIALKAELALRRFGIAQD